MCIRDSLDAAEEGGQHRAHQQHIEHIVLGLFKNRAVDHRGGDAHKHYVHCEGQVGVGGHHAGRPLFLIHI